jgi:hypothetical protein
MLGGLRVWCLGSNDEAFELLGQGDFAQTREVLKEVLGENDPDNIQALEMIVGLVEDPEERTRIFDELNRNDPMVMYGELERHSDLLKPSSIRIACALCVCFESKAVCERSQASQKIKEENNYMLAIYMRSMTVQQTWGNALLPTKTEFPMH